MISFDEYLQENILKRIFRKARKKASNAVDPDREIIHHENQAKKYAKGTDEHHYHKAVHHGLRVMKASILGDPSAADYQEAEMKKHLAKIKSGTVKTKVYNKLETGD